MKAVTVCVIDNLSVPDTKSVIVSVAVELDVLTTGSAPVAELTANTNVSAPVPPVKLSAPAPPVMVSAPGPPTIVSAPDPPVIDCAAVDVVWPLMLAPAVLHVAPVTLETPPTATPANKLVVNAVAS